MNGNNTMQYNKIQSSGQFAVAKCALVEDTLDTLRGTERGVNS